MTQRPSADSLAERYRTALAPLSGLEEVIGRHRDALAGGSWDPNPDEVVAALQVLEDQVAAARRAVEALQQAERDERRRLGHDMRVALNAIAGWAHILRLEKSASENVLRAADVLDRNVRALTKVIEAAHQ